MQIDLNSPDGLTLEAVRQLLASASDEVWVMQIFNALKENWPNPPYDYIDVY